MPIAIDAHRHLVWPKVIDTKRKMSMFLWILCVLLNLALVLFVSRILRLNSYVKDLPSIPLAAMWPLLRWKKSSLDLYQQIERIVNSCNGMAYMWLGPKLAIVCDDPEDAKTIFLSKDCVTKPYVYRMLFGTGDGLFTSNGHIWKTDRRNMNTVFTPSVLKQFEPIFNREFANLARTLESCADVPAESDLTRHVFECNFGVICGTILRFDYKTIANEFSNKKAVEYIGRVWTIATKRAAQFLLHPSFVYRLTRLYAEEKEVGDFLFKLGPTVIQSHRTKSLANKSIQKDHGAKSSLIFIDKLLELEKDGLIDRQRVLDQINTFIVAGIDTNSRTSLNTLLLLAMHPDVQDRLYEEIRSHATSSDYIDYDTISKLDLLDRVLKESQRLLPVGQVLLRETEADVPLTKCTAPKGTMLIVCLSKMGRCEKIWGPTAGTFDPDHFLPDVLANVHPYAFVPFAAGPRNCIGYKYALLAMKTLACHILLKYKLTSSLTMDDIVFKQEFLLKLDNQYLMRLERR